MEGQEGRGWQEVQIQEGDTFTVRLALSGLLAKPLGMPMGKPLGGPGIQGWPVGGKFVFALEGTFIWKYVTWMLPI